MEEGTYDVMIVAGDEPYWLSESLFHLAKDVGIPPPQFYGRGVYCDYNGAEKWLITTLIQGRIVDDLDHEMLYTEPYPDWNMSVGMAIHGAISRICYKYRPYITHGSVYRFFGERNMAGDAIDRGNQHTTAIRTHFMEREALSVSTGELLQRQIAVIDVQRDRIRKMETTIFNMYNAMDELKAKEEHKEAMILGWRAQSIHLATKYNGRNQAEEENDALKREMEDLKMENEALKRTIAELTEERASKNNPRKRLTAPQYRKLFKPAPRK